MLRSNNASEAWNSRFNKANNGQRQSFWRLLRQLRRYGTVNAFLKTHKRKFYCTVRTGRK
jgi:hypothetical protein